MRRRASQSTTSIVMRSETTGGSCGTWL
jgi:hypothetical protein